MASQIVAIGGDPGGAAALAPVLKLLQEQGRPVRALAYRQAITNWRSCGLCIEELPESTDLEHVQQRLSSGGTDVLLSATSANGIDLEKNFIAAARNLGIPSLAVLDHWGNYRLRFADRKGRLIYCPDRVAVMDERARAEMIAEGFDAERLVVTGQPAFDELPSLRRAATPQQRMAVRRMLGISAKHMVLFASEPISRLCGTEPSHPSYPGYTEQTVLRALVLALVRIAERRSQQIALCVRPHPRDGPGDLKLPQEVPLQVVLDRRGKGREVVMAADVVVGMTTILLVEACLLGCVVLSLQPGLRFPDPLPTNHWGVSQAVYREEDIESALEESLFDARVRERVVERTANIPLAPGAAGRVVHVLDSLSGLRWPVNQE